MGAMLPTDPLAVKELARVLQFEGDPEVIFGETSRALTEKRPEDMTLLELRRLAFAAGIGSQYNIADAVDEQYSPLAVSFARQLIEEYECKAPSEIAMAEAAAVSYAQYISYSKQGRTYRRDTITLREIDRAYRRFISAIGTLRQMKRPPLSVNINTQAAFVAQNQQVNSITND